MKERRRGSWKRGPFVWTRAKNLEAKMKKLRLQAPIDEYRGGAEWRPFSPL